MSKGLLGHSDADVLTHAVMDALLGAAGLGDIGKHFPDTDPAYAGADSLKLLEHVVGAAEGAGLAGGQCGCHHSGPAAQAGSLHPQPCAGQPGRGIWEWRQEQVNVKATTEEGLGFTGSGEGMAAHAVCLLEK